MARGLGLWPHHDCLRVPQRRPQAEESPPDFLPPHHPHFPTTHRPKDVEKRQVRAVRRDTGEKEDVPVAVLVQKVGTK